MRLIDADELKALYDDAEFVGEKWHVPIRVILANIDDMPTIDTVKHGRWEWIGGYGYQYRCSECILCAERQTKYCPNCGAYMRERKEE